MAQGNSNGNAPAKGRPDTGRQARLAEALRANLRKRKAQAQARARRQADDPPRDDPARDG